MASLRQLEAQLLRCVPEVSTERVPDGEEHAGLYVFRDSEDGHPTMWSPRPERMTFAPVELVSEAHGVRFLCPQSFSKNGGTKGTHSVYIFFTGSPYAGRNTAGEEVRWQVIGGSTIDDLQLSPSIQEQDGPGPNACNWHGFVGSNGVAPGHAA